MKYAIKIQKVMWEKPLWVVTYGGNPGEWALSDVEWAPSPPKLFDTPMQAHDFILEWPFLRMHVGDVEIIDEEDLAILQVMDQL